VPQTVSAESAQQESKQSVPLKKRTPPRKKKSLRAAAGHKAPNVELVHAVGVGPPSGKRHGELKGILL
jgi:hypothetical protein